MKGAVTIVIPKDARAKVPCSDGDYHIVFPIYFPPRLLWNHLYPIVERGDKEIFRRLVRILISYLTVTPSSMDMKFMSASSHQKLKAGVSYESNGIEGLKNVTFHRESHRHGQLPSQWVTFWVYPDPRVFFENGFGARLNCLERGLIRAQSYAGLFATMGGGYYMCHHWKTAVHLAQRQRALARILGDKEMYYKCGLNQAYNYIFAGYFKTARNIIQDVYQAAGRESKTDLVVLNMCKSAWLFCCRVRKAKLRHNKQQVSGTVDDFSRIRLVEDKSTTRDLEQTHQMISS